MPALNFVEIPAANTGSGLQDSFELFAREALECFELRIVEQPGRGADLGKDLVAEEVRTGPLATDSFRWLVSCKHFAHSGRAVAISDELAITERLAVHDCKGFMGFYSTIPSSSFLETLRRQHFATYILDREQIETKLLNSDRGRGLIRRFFPESCRAFQTTPATIFDVPATLECEHCGADLFSRPPHSAVWVIWRTGGTNRSGMRSYIDMHFSCKGACDRAMKDELEFRYRELGNIYDGWDDLSDLLVPTIYLSKFMAILNGLFGGATYSEQAAGNS